MISIMKQNSRKVYRQIITICVILLVISCDKTDNEPGRVGLEDPVFQYISNNWIPDYFKISMDDMWQYEGINRNGDNYYFLPKPIAPFECSSRFIPDSDYFQTWLGMYTISDNSQGTYALESGIPDKEAILALTIADQKGWLKAFGLNNPSVQIDSSSPISIESIEINFQQGWKINGRLISNVDVGINNPLVVESELLSVKKEYWDEDVASYQQVILDVTTYVWYAPENKELNVAYINLVEFISNDGQTITNEHILPELEEMIEGITVYQ